MTDRAAEIAALYITDPADRDALAESIRIEMRAARHEALTWALTECERHRVKGSAPEAYTYNQALLDVAVYIEDELDRVTK